ncbi:hypothetical protein I41_20760 [Lacipirellula limnantheis]|uniref:Uncharacterized protein n=1 Tax=Lacipirellula limnantheis TaxID=2528024 RepID=A0A517TWZ1_9BACT|nr:hypothetical protein I41_20760 [Lacipirellula limnantheis]
MRTCLAFAAVCGVSFGCSDPLPLTVSSIRPPTPAPSPPARPQRPATVSTTRVLDVTQAASEPLDVNTINPVKMRTDAGSRSGFNPFAN